MRIVELIVAQVMHGLIYNVLATLCLQVAINVNCELSSTNNMTIDACLHCFGTFKVLLRYRIGSKLNSAPSEEELRELVSFSYLDSHISSGDRILDKFL